jgi:hypothetical protein
VTNHRGDGAFANHDIRTGGFRKLDLFAAPFHFPSDVQFLIREGPATDSDHEMCLWTRERILAVLPGFESALGKAEREPAN